MVDREREIVIGGCILADYVPSDDTCIGGTCFATGSWTDVRLGISAAHRGEHPHVAALHHHVAGFGNSHRSGARSKWCVCALAGIQAPANDVYERRGAGTDDWA